MYFSSEQGYLEKFCENNDDCSNILHSVCSKNNGCVCIANYTALNKTTCAPLLNEPCLDDGECATLNAVCIDNKCQCKRKYLPESSHNCIPG